MSKPIIGKILNPDKEYKRDAIHVPIMPVLAGCVLDPGEKIILIDGMAMNCTDISKAVAIVDPYLERPVESGDNFYAWIKPNTVKNLWHEWTHGGIDKS